MNLVEKFLHQSQQTQVNKFIEHSKGQSERDKTIRDLSGKYKAYQIGLTSINLLKQDDVTGGPKGRLALFSKRLGDALNDFGYWLFR